MKLKFYLRGLGVGVLVTTLILTVANRVRDNEIPFSENPSTVASSSKAETKAVKTEQTTEQTKETSAATMAEVVSQAPVQTAAEKVTEATIVQKVEANSQPITVVLSNISNSEKAAQAVANAGVIDNWMDFNKYLESSGYATKIHNGTYSLLKGQDYESIAKIITGN